MTHIRIHPKSLPITPGWSQIGPAPRRTTKALPQSAVNKAFRETLAREANPRIAKIRKKLNRGELTETEAVIGVIENLLGVKPPRVAVKGFK